MSRNAKETTGSTVNRNFKTTTFKWISPRTPQTSAKRSKLSVPAAGNPQSKGSWRAVLFTIQINSPYMRECGFWNPGNFCFWNLEYRLRNPGLETRVQVPLTKTGITWNSESTAWGPESRLELPWSGVTYGESILKGKWEMVKLTTNPCSAVFSLWAVHYLT